MERRRSMSCVGRVATALIALAVTMVAAACGSGGTSRSSATQSAPPTAVASTSPSALAVTSTLDGHARLPVRIHWEATPNLPAAKVTEADFLIDGQLAWVEHRAPYFYGSDGNWLVTTFLRPGRHTFTVRVIGTEGQTAKDTVQAVVSPPPEPPAELVGVWSRNIPGLSQDARRWRITITSSGWSFDDPNGGGQNQDVSYPAPGRVVIRAAIEKPLFGSYDRGGAFCGEEPDPAGLYTYRVSSGGRMLTLTPVGKDCRRALLGGTWSRVNQ